MKAMVFDGIARELGTSSTRRSFFRLLGGASAVGIGVALNAGEATDARDRGKSKHKPRGAGRSQERVSAQRRGGGKITLCHRGQTVKASKRGWQKRYPGATRGPCGNGDNNKENNVTREDAACPGPGGSVFGTAYANARFAQTFTARTSGQLVTAQVTLIKDAGSVGDYVATINTVDANGVPTNTVLATASIPNASAVAGESQASFGFPKPATVEAGTQYALVVSRTGANPLRLRGDGGNRCIGGAYDSPNQTSPFLSTGPAIDFDFKLFVRS